MEVRRSGRRWRGRWLAAIGACSLGLLGAAVAAADPSANPGSQDPSFGTGGLTQSTYGGAGTTSAITDLVVAPDGSIYAAGYVYPNAATGVTGKQLVVAKYTSTGQLDTSFGQSGYSILTAVVTPASSLTPTLAPRIVLTSSGDVVAAFLAQGSSGNEVGLAALTPQGSLDPSFDPTGPTPGILIEANNPAAGQYGATQDVEGLAAGPNGGVYVGGWLTTGNYSSLAYVQEVTATGALDLDFGTNGAWSGGITQGSDAQLSEVRAVSVDGSGDIIVGEEHRDLTQQTSQFAIQRLTPAGALDPAFASTVVTPTSGLAVDNVPNALELLPDGNVVMAGEASAGETGYAVDPSEVEAVEFKATGGVDTAFGVSGTYLDQVGGSADLNQIYSVLAQSDGDLVLSGVFTGPEQLVTRLTPAGALDPAFGTAGVQLTQLATNSGALTAALSSDGQLLTGGPPHSCTCDESASLPALLDEEYLTGGATTTPSTPSTGAGPAPPQTGSVSTGTAPAGAPVPTGSEVSDGAVTSSGDSSVKSTNGAGAGPTRITGTSRPSIVSAAISDHGRIVTVTLAGTGQAVHGTATLTWRKGRTVRTIATHPIGASTKLVLHLNPTGRALLKHHKSLEVTLTVTMGNGSATHVSSRALKL